MNYLPPFTFHPSYFFECINQIIISSVFRYYQNTLILSTLIQHIVCIKKHIQDIPNILKAPSRSQELSKILKSGSLSFGLRLFGVSEPRLTEESPLMNPKNHKFLRLNLLYAMPHIKSTGFNILYHFPT